MSKLLRCGPNHQTLVDDDFEIPEGFRLGICNGYAEIRSTNKINGKWQYNFLHRHVLGLFRGRPVVDHINRDKLDNRRDNLRMCTDQLNGRNRPAKGAYYSKDRNLWTTHVMENRKSIHLGRYKTEREAIIAVNDYKLKNWGEFAVLWPVPTESQQQLA